MSRSLTALVAAMSEALTAGAVSSQLDPNVVTTFAQLSTEAHAGAAASFEALGAGDAAAMMERLTAAQQSLADVGGAAASLAAQLQLMQRDVETLRAEVQALREAVAADMPQAQS